MGAAVSWLRRNWRKVAGYTCGAATVALVFTPAAPAAAPLGWLCGKLFADDYHEGQRLAELVDGALREMRDMAARAKHAPTTPKPGT